MKLIEKFKQIISYNDNTAIDKLNKPISELQVKEIEKLTNETMPNEFKELYRFANGQKLNEKGIFFDEYFIGSDKKIEQLKFSLSLVKPEIKKINDKEKSEKLIKEMISFVQEKTIKNKFFGFKEKWHKIEFSCSPISIGGPYLYKNENSNNREIRKIKDYNNLLNIVDKLHKLEKETYNWDELECVIYYNGKYDCKRTFYDFDNEIDFTSTPKNAIKKKYFHYKWIPIFSDCGGNYIGMDLDPDINGKKGQIINFGRDEEDMFVLANNLNDFFDLILNEISKENNRLLDNETHLHEILKELTK